MLMLCSLLTVGWVPGSSEVSSPPVPLKRRAVVGVNHPLSDDAPVNKSFHALEADLNFTFPVVGVFYSFDTSWAAHTASLNNLNGRALLVCWMPQRTAEVVQLSDIVAGRYDTHIDQMLDGMRTYAGPVIVRWGHEMNGNWYPWSVTYGRRNPGAGGCASASEYVAAWRYIVERERALPGTSNVKWFWCTNAQDHAGPDDIKVQMESYWPGRSWVDIVGCDAYNDPARWASFDSLFGSPYDRISTIGGGKPFWVGETGCQEPGPNLQLTETKAKWVAGMLDSDRFPLMQAVCYFDYDARSLGGADWRFSSAKETYLSVRKVLRGAYVISLIPAISNA